MEHEMQSERHDGLSDNERLQHTFDQAFERRSVSLAEVQEVTRIEFPRGTSLIRAERLDWLDAYLFAKLQVNASAYQQFIQLPQFAGKFSSTDRHGIRNGLPSPTRMPWWRPDEVQSFLSAEYTVRDNRYWDKSRAFWAQTAVLISVGRKGEKTHTVYLYWRAWHE